MALRPITRRRFLASSSAALALVPVGCAAPALTPPPVPGVGEPADPWDAPGSVDGDAFLFGVHVGDAQQADAVLSIQTSVGGLTVLLARGEDGAWIEEEARTIGDPVDGVVQAELLDLLPDTAYSVAVAREGGGRSAVTRFKTAPLESRVLRFGATSCLGGNLPWSTLSHAAKEKLDFFLMNGDTIYADGVATAGIRGLWRDALAVQGLAELSRSTSLIATWDDHEVDNNWSRITDGIDARVEVALAELKRHLPQRQGGGELGIWRQLSFGAAADVFVLDSRGERDGALYMSVEQLEWLKAGLAASTARFKIILNTVPIIDLADVVGDIEANDRWQGFPAQRAELVAHVAGIEGVLFVSGDFHLGGIGYLDPPGGPGAGVVEVLAGPGGSPINPAQQFVQFNPARFPAIVSAHNYTLFEADPDTGVVNVKFIGDDGEVIVEQDLQL